jgi:hypothetical protein
LRFLGAVGIDAEGACVGSKSAGSISTFAMWISRFQTETWSLTVLDTDELVDHSLVRQLCTHRCNPVHRTVKDDQTVHRI